MPAARVFDLALIDFDGTLCATHLAIIHCIRAVFMSFGDAVPGSAAIQEVIGRGITLEDTFRTLAPDLVAADEALLPELVRSYRTLYSIEADAKTTLFPGWRGALAALTEAGVRIAVVSNKGPTAVKAALDRFAIADLVTLVLADTPGAPKKPDPAIFTQIVQPLFPAILPERILVVGDTDADIRLALNAGLRSCWARYGYGNHASCEALRPHFIIDSPDELPALATRVHPL